MEREPDYYELPYDDFVEALEKKVVEQRTKGFGLPEDYASALELADVSPDWPGVYVSLAEATELIPEETLQNELYRAMGEAAAVHMDATAIDGRKAGVKEEHGNIAELTDRALRVGGLLALLSRRQDRGQ